MFGARAQAPRPVLILLVYAIFLVIVGVTATAQTVMLSENFSEATLRSVVANDAALIRSFVNTSLRPSDLDLDTTTADRRAALERDLSLLVERAEILRLEVRLPDGRVAFSTESGLAGTGTLASPDFLAAVDGRIAAAGIDPVAQSEAAGSALPTTDVLREYFPLQADGQVQAVVGVWRDAVPILRKLDDVRRDIVISTLSAAVVAGLVLSLVFRSAQGRIARQAEALVEATRRDPLTGLLNHGALVDALAVTMDQSRSDDAPVGVALIDIDGFRLLNETYGHDAGDRALLTLSTALADVLPAEIVAGRYGPDEFLLIAPAAQVPSLGSLLDDLRARLADAALEIDTSERLPLTVSGGVCDYPEHADSVTGLLTIAAVTVQEAKSGGGDAIRFAGVAPESTGETRTFDVFQGLILAVDTKDRYTKRHSEDVARYATFIAGRMGLDEEFQQTIRVAGLLHDVGKIGVPDHILRKPGPLTDEEYGAIKQHVALGDMIVRDLPDIETIRAGVRHHHERWDGKGYLHGLEGEGIPLVARILAVCDAFSAMTTTRPYRKALDISEALHRLEDAAGTQLDERIVSTFTSGIETAADAPLPGTDDGVRLWTPYRRVA